MAGSISTAVICANGNLRKRAKLIIPVPQPKSRTRGEAGSSKGRRFTYLVRARLCPASVIQRSQIGAKYAYNSFCCEVIVSKAFFQPRFPFPLHRGGLGGNQLQAQSRSLKVRKF